MFVIVPALLGWYHRSRSHRTPPVEPATTSRARRLVRRRPIASFLVLGFAGLWTCLLPVLAVGAPYRVFTAIGAFVGLALPAVVVTWAVDGREGLLDLMRRTTRWRVPLRWYAFALAAIPLGAMIGGRLLLGPADGSTAAGLRLVLVFVAEVALALVTVQLLEEVAWTGLVQHRLQRRYGALRACLLVAPAFALIHLPTYFIGAPVNGEKALAVALQMLVIIPFAVVFRALIAWTYNVTAHSVLLAATLHASFNTASGSAFIAHLSAAGTPPSVASLLPLLSVVVLASGVLVCTRGRLGQARPAA